VVVGCDFVSMGIGGDGDKRRPGRGRGRLRAIHCSTGSTFGSIVQIRRERQISWSFCVGCIGVLLCCDAVFGGMARGRRRAACPTRRRLPLLVETRRPKWIEEQTTDQVLHFSRTALCGVRDRHSTSFRCYIKAKREWRKGRCFSSLR